MKKQYNVGTDNLPTYIKVILSQNPGVDKAAVIHDSDYGLGHFIDASGKVVKLNRKKADIRFRENILEFTGRLDLADAYYKAIRKVGAYGWYRARLRTLIKKIKGWLK